ncbi:MAG: TAXI family TRAP transporter solute-binding subunit [Rhodocyclaceae bacterium]|nr:TAXI family TRAP transporter solute-binding subunit [Rhodocyclaceae bacterium]
MTPDAAQQNNKPRSFRRLPRIPRISWRDLAATLGPVLLASTIAIAVAIHFVQPAPPHTITISAGPDGSTFRNVAEKYRVILARNGIKLDILPSAGSLDNLKRLTDPKSRVDVGFVQGGVATGTDIDDVVSLGSVFYEPLAIFYRSPRPLQRLSQFSGKRVAIGPEGSGTRALALALLKANEIQPHGKTQLLDLAGAAAMEALLKHQVDAAFLMGDSAAPGNIRQMLHTKGIRLFDFPQADGYLRRFRYLSKLELPAGAFDLGANLPRKPTAMLAPTVELVARADLHPALSDLLIEAAREVHGHATLLQHAGEFPAPLEHEYPISADAARYYKSGKSFAYSHLPFWLASLADRILVVAVPLVIILIPGLRLVPTLYGWRIRTRIYRRYGELMALERAALAPVTPDERAALLARLNDIEKSAIIGKIPGSFADETYVLRQHIKFVRERLAQTNTAATAVDAAPGSATAPGARP